MPPMPSEGGPPSHLHGWPPPPGAGTPPLNRSHRRRWILLGVTLIIVVPLTLGLLQGTIPQNPCPGSPGCGHNFRDDIRDYGFFLVGR